jgi:hypothetical protein
MGLLSLNDIAREVARERRASGKAEVGIEEVAETLGAIRARREQPRARFCRLTSRGAAGDPRPPPPSDLVKCQRRR